MDSAVRSVYLTLPVIVAIISDVFAYEVCSSFRSCADGQHCCRNNTRCCEDSLSVAVIVGISIGCIVVVCLLTALLIRCLCKKHTSRGTVFNSSQQAGTTVFPTAQPAYGQQMYGQPMYSQPMYGQPAGLQQHGIQQPVGGNKMDTSNSDYPRSTYPPPLPGSYS